MTGLLFCRECAEGKHVNCDGTAWSNELDGPAPCTCPDQSHGDPPFARALVETRTEYREAFDRLNDGPSR